jgi:phytoene dehydrogenase-like protein
MALRLPGCFLPPRCCVRVCGVRARALLAGCAAHAILPLEQPLTAAVGMIFALTAHVEDWPIAAGGSHSIAHALASYLRQLGGRIDTGRLVRSLADIPPARVILFDTSQAQLADVCEPLLPAGYVRRRRSHGPGVKLNWALDGPIRRDPRCLDASTVHLGGTLEEIARPSRGGAAASRTAVRLVVQQSQFDPSRHRRVTHRLCLRHVPPRSAVDHRGDRATDERFAPVFTSAFWHARHGPADFERRIPTTSAARSPEGLGHTQFSPAGGADRSLLHAASAPPFICSASRPRQRARHGMCGYFAARSARRALDRLPAAVPELVRARAARLHVV